MKLAGSFIVLAFGFSFSAQAGTSAAIQERLLKTAANNKAVVALLDQSASEVKMARKDCKITTVAEGEADSFNSNKTVSGDVEIEQICDNVDLDGATNLKIKGMVSSDRFLIGEVKIYHSGF